MSITIKDNAFEKISSLLDGNAEKFLKIVAEPGGCAGMRLKASICERADSDIEIKCAEFFILTNTESEKYLRNIIIYLSDDISEDIIVKNNDGASCRCGNSFRAT